MPSAPFAVPNMIGIPSASTSTPGRESQGFAVLDRSRELAEDRGGVFGTFFRRDDLSYENGPGAQFVFSAPWQGDGADRPQVEDVAVADQSHPADPPLNFERESFRRVGFPA